MEYKDTSQTPHHPRAGPTIRSVWCYSWAAAPQWLRELLGCPKQPKQLIGMDQPINRSTDQPNHFFGVFRRKICFFSGK